MGKVGCGQMQESPSSRLQELDFLPGQGCDCAPVRRALLEAPDIPTKPALGKLAARWETDRTMTHGAGALQESEGAKGGFKGGAWLQAVPPQRLHGVGADPPCHMRVKAF